PPSAAPASLYAPHRPPPTSTLFPYTTLFRSRGLAGKVRHLAERLAGAQLVEELALLRHPHPALRQDAEVIPGLALAHQHFARGRDRKSTRLNSSHDQISYAVFCLKKKTDSVR